MLSALLLVLALLPTGNDTPTLGEVGTSFAAKRACSAIFLGGRTLESLRAEEFAPETPLDMILAPQLEFEVDREQHMVTVRGLGAQRTALFRPGLGAVLLGHRSREDLLAEDAEVPSSNLGLDLRTPWPRGDRDATGPALEPQASERLHAALDEVFDDSQRKQRTRAVIVIQHGKIIAERYAQGFGPQSRLEGWSMTKSLVSALVGIRIGQARLALADDQLFREWSAQGDARAAINVDQLLRMSSGLVWNESYTDITADPVRMLFLAASCVDVPREAELAAPPDTRWSYSSGSINLLSGVLRQSFKTTADYHAFPREALFTPAGMRSAVIECDPGGNFVGSSFSWATARDWARFGLLYLNDGVVAGERVLPEGWVALSVEPSPTAPNGNYGRSWWLNSGDPQNRERRTYPELPTDLFYAHGFEDQIIAVVPSRDMVIVRLGCTKGNGAFRTQEFLAGVLDALE